MVYYLFVDINTNPSKLSFVSSAVKPKGGAKNFLNEIDYKINKISEIRNNKNNVNSNTSSHFSIFTRLRNKIFPLKIAPNLTEYEKARIEKEIKKVEINVQKRKFFKFFSWIPFTTAHKVAQLLSIISKKTHIRDLDKHDFFTTPHQINFDDLTATNKKDVYQLYYYINNATKESFISSDIKNIEGCDCFLINIEKDGDDRMRLYQDQPNAENIDMLDVYKTFLSM